MTMDKGQKLQEWKHVRVNLEKYDQVQYDQEVWKSGSPEARKPGSQEVRKSGKLKSF